MEHEIQFWPIQNTKKIVYQIHQEIHENHINMKKKINNLLLNVIVNFWME